MSTHVAIKYQEFDPSHNIYDYSHALVRPMPSSFVDGLKMSAPGIPIDLHKAESQHRGYDSLLRQLVGQVIEVSADNAQPDSVFVEDTVVIIGGTAVTTIPGEL